MKNNKGLFSAKLTRTIVFIYLIVAVLLLCNHTFRFLTADQREMLGLYNECCYYNREHLNYYGAGKYTDYLAQYLIDNYDIPDRRGDDRYSSWEDDYDRLMEDLNTKHAKRYHKMMDAVKNVEGEYN